MMIRDTWLKLRRCKRGDVIALACVLAAAMAAGLPHKLAGDLLAAFVAEQLTFWCGLALWCGSEGEQ